MSAFGTKRTWACALQMSAFGVKRTCVIALQMSAFDPKRTSMAQNETARRSIRRAAILSLC